MKFSIKKFVVTQPRFLALSISKTQVVCRNWRRDAQGVEDIRTDEIAVSICDVPYGLGTMILLGTP
ncbi:hypothetical protein ASE00_22070 [Sphingomonas sp. Root710]|nr:hypothetical protein ASE00_22070 [Sphingomonas sp. Root710]